MKLSRERSATNPSKQEAVQWPQLVTCYAFSFAAREDKGHFKAHARHFFIPILLISQRNLVWSPPCFGSQPFGAVELNGRVCWYVQTFTSSPSGSHPLPSTVPREGYTESILFHILRTGFFFLMMRVLSPVLSRPADRVQLLRKRVGLGFHSETGVAFSLQCYSIDCTIVEVNYFCSLSLSPLPLAVKDHHGV